MKQHRFDTLDGIRGLAAIAVMVFHYTEHNGLHWLPSAWVAVDLFFVLSGFVIAHSYTKKLRDGMSFGTFAALRWRRLGPLYLVGLLLGIMALAVTASVEHDVQVTGIEAASAIGLDLVWLPYLNQEVWPFDGDVVRGPIFPLNIPAWSLFFEACVNIVFYAHVRRFGRASGFWLVALSAAVFVAVTVGTGVINPGWSGGTLAHGFPRAVFEFFLGALIFQLRLHERRVPPPLVGLVVLVTLAGFVSPNAKVALVDAFLFAPLALVSAASVQVTGRARALCQWLGDLSYPLYIVHYPLFQLTFELSGLRGADPRLQVVAMGLLAIGVAGLLARGDRALRQRVRRPPRAALMG